MMRPICSIGTVENISVIDVDDDDDPPLIAIL